jgi:hypothetical protein
LHRMRRSCSRYQRFRLMTEFRSLLSTLFNDLMASFGFCPMRGQTDLGWSLSDLCCSRLNFRWLPEPKHR